MSRNISVRSTIELVFVYYVRLGYNGYSIAMQGDDYVFSLIVKNNWKLVA